MFAENYEIKSTTPQILNFLHALGAFNSIFDENISDLFLWLVLSVGDSEREIRRHRFFL